MLSLIPSKSLQLKLQFINRAEARPLYPSPSEPLVHSLSDRIRETSKPFAMYNRTETIMLDKSGPSANMQDMKKCQPCEASSYNPSPQLPASLIPSQPHDQLLFVQVSFADGDARRIF